MMFKAQVGSELLNKRTGEKVLLVAENKVTKILGYDENGYILSEDPADTLELNEGNMVNFRYLVCHENRETIPMEILEVKDGILYRNGVPALEAQGDVVVETIIGSLPGAVILITRKEGRDTSDLVLLDVERDRFDKVESNVHNVLALADGLRVVVLSRNKEDIPEKKDANGQVIEAARIEVNDSRVITFTSDGRHTSNCTAYVEGYPECVAKIPNSDLYAVNTTEYPTGEDPRDVIVVLRSNGAFEESFDGKVISARVTANGHQTVVVDGKMILDSTGFNPVTLNAAISAQLKGYALIDTGDGKLYFADETGANVKVVAVKTTKDRGTIYEVK